MREKLTAVVSYGPLFGKKELLKLVTNLLPWNIGGIHCLCVIKKIF